MMNNSLAASAIITASLINIMNTRSIDGSVCLFIITVFNFLYFINYDFFSSLFFLFIEIKKITQNKIIHLIDVYSRKYPKRVTKK